jgi:hypothetical protein
VVKIDDGKAGRWRVWMTGDEWQVVLGAATELRDELASGQGAAAEVARFVLADLIEFAGRRAGSRPNALVFDRGMVRAIPAVLGGNPLARRIAADIEAREAEEAKEAEEQQARTADRPRPWAG